MDCPSLSVVYCYSGNVPIAQPNTFEKCNLKEAVLYVPKGSWQDFWMAEGWGDFGNIVEFEATNINKIAANKDAKEISRYSANGQRLTAPTKGLNIVKYSDGSVRKEMVK